VDLLQAVVLGVVQGLTEFLPISSSGHLILVPWLLRWDDPGLVFDVALHCGTLVALVGYFWRTWLRLLLHDWRLLLLLALGSLPGGVVGFLGSGFIEAHFRHPLQVALALALFGLLLLWVDRVGSKTRDSAAFTWRDALIIGGAQALALLPGVSRSGITITAGLLLGFKREVAATYSFLLATPITAGAVLWAARRLLHDGIPPNEQAAFAAGVLSSGVAGALAIHYLLHFVRTRSYAPFVAYRLVVGGLVGIVALVRG